MGLLELAWFVTFGWAELPGVLWVLPDSYLDVPNKDYGGEFVNDCKPNGIPHAAAAPQPTPSPPYLSFFAPWCLIYLSDFLSLLLFSCFLASGDLFIDGKVIPRPQFRYSDRQQPSRNRPRPRFDRRREAMQVERREPMQTRTQDVDADNQHWTWKFSLWSPRFHHFF